MSYSATFDTTFSDVENFKTVFTAEETFNTEMTQIVEVVTSDHRQLNHRDAVDQHPITSITNLIPELGVRPSTAMSNQDIQNILST